MRRKSDIFPLAEERIRVPSEKKTVLILGCGLLQRPAIETAAAFGWTVVGFDGNPNAEATSLCDQFETVDISDTEAVVSAAQTIAERLPIDGVFTAGTDFSYSVAVTAERLGLPGLPPTVAFRASHKDAMRECFLQNGVSSPAFVTAASPAQSSEARKLPLPLVVKPVDNMGGRGTVRIDRYEDLSAAVEEALKFSRTKTAVIEEFIDGPEFSLDGIVQNGKLTVTGFADRIICFPPYFIETGHTMPTAASAEIRSAVIAEFEKAVAALGIRDGAAKGDIKYSPSRKKAVVGEVAARLSGGFMSGWTYPYASGINVTAAALRVAVGLPAALPRTEKRRVSAERAFLSVPGEVVCVEGLCDAMKIRGVRHVFLRVKSGGRVRFPRNNVEKCGNVISVSRCRRKAVCAAEKAAETIFVRLKPGDPETEAYLIYGKGVFAPRFTLRKAPAYQFFYKKREENFSDLLISFSQEPLFIEEKDDAAFRGGLKRLKRMRIFAGEKKANLILGELFYRVYLRGGVQGAVWLADTVRHFFKLGILDEVLEKWRGNCLGDSAAD